MRLDVEFHEMPLMMCYGQHDLSKRNFLQARPPTPETGKAVELREDGFSSLPLQWGGLSSPSTGMEYVAFGAVAWNATLRLQTAVRYQHIPWKKIAAPAVVNMSFISVVA